MHELKFGCYKQVQQMIDTIQYINNKLSLTELTLSVKLSDSFQNQQLQKYIYKLLKTVKNNIPNLPIIHFDLCSITMDECYKLSKIILEKSVIMFQSMLLSYIVW